jgi:16S rRNA A1518/A1519 N6-dimethyltransferase RsmA/KsgA/DIM1 with predicted DNA glycosylase/AP lyase activity
VEVVPFDTLGERPRLPGPDEELLWHLVQASFRERRKKLHNVLARQLPFAWPEVAGALVSAGIDGDRRPQTLSVDEWLALLAALGPWPPATGTERGAKPARAGVRR